MFPIVTYAQALYDLREVTAFSGCDLQAMFHQLLGEASPSGMEVIRLSELEELYPETHQLLTVENYCVLTQHAGYWRVWKTPKGNVKKFNMVAASTFAHQMNGQAVTLSQAQYLEGKEAELVKVEDGLVVDDTTEDRQLIEL